MSKVLIFLIGVLSLQAQNLMPLPAKMTPGQGRLTFDGSFRIAVEGNGGARLEAAAARLTRLLALKTGVPMRAEQSGSAALTVRCDQPGPRIPGVREDESYRLSVAPRGARLTAPNTLGALRGLATFYQLVEIGPDGFGAPAVEIEDSPRFPWRGLMIDVARHWMPLEVIHRNLDAMELVKLNVLHLHLSDNQGFRVESKLYPKLQGMGSDGHFFTQDQLREIVNYAADRGIRVLPEFDMPGHSTSWFVGYPELAARPGPYQIDRVWGVLNPCMDPSKEEVYRFLDGFIGEMAAIFPDPYFHIGGDEVNGKDWNASASITAFKAAHNMKSNHDFQAYFNKRLVAIVTKHGKKMIGWDEILHPDLPKDVVVHSWRGQKSLADAARQGYSGILSFGYYLDLMQHASQHYGVDPMTGPTANLSPEEKQRILGGEACEWSEIATAENLDARVWPRTAAIAERLWSPQDVTDLASMYRRLSVVGHSLAWAGVEHETSYLQMLRRIAGAHSIEPVRVLAEVVEPQKGYGRPAFHKNTSFTPLNRLADVATPDSMRARAFGVLVDRFLSDKTGAEDLRRQLVNWRDNDRRLAPVLRDSELLSDAAPLSQDLTALATAALEAVDFIEKGAHAPGGWAEKQKALLDQAGKPHAEVQLAVLQPVGRLFAAAK